MSKLDSPDAELIKLCIKALGAQAACCTANDTPKGVSDDLMDALNDRVYAAIEPLAAMQATTKFGNRLKAKFGYVVLQSCATDYAPDEDGKNVSIARKRLPCRRCAIWRRPRQEPAVRD
jgi:hypothetical protein